MVHQSATVANCAAVSRERAVKPRPRRHWPATRGWTCLIALLACAGCCAVAQTPGHAEWLTVDYLKCAPDKRSACVSALSNGPARSLPSGETPYGLRRSRAVLLLKDPFTPDPEYDIAILSLSTAAPDPQGSHDTVGRAPWGGSAFSGLVRTESYLTMHRAGLPVPGSFMRITDFEIAPGFENHAFAWCGNVLLPFARGDIDTGEAVAFSCSVLRRPAAPGARHRLMVATAFPDVDTMLDAGTVPGAVNTLRPRQPDRPFAFSPVTRSETANWRKQLRARTWEVIAADGGAAGDLRTPGDLSNEISMWNQR